VPFAKVVLALMLGRPPGRDLDAQRAAHPQQMRELSDLTQNGDVMDTLLAGSGQSPRPEPLAWPGRDPHSLV
jgi:hypothetical protein